MTPCGGNLCRRLTTVESNKKMAKCIIALADEEGKILNCNYFEVKGQGTNRIFLDGDEKGALSN